MIIFIRKSTRACSIELFPFRISSSSLFGFLAMLLSKLYYYAVNDIIAILVYFVILIKLLT